MTTTRIVIKDMVFPLSQSQNDTIEALTSNSIYNKIQGYCEYFRGVEEARNQLVTTTRAGAIAGGVLGLIAAFFISSQKDEDEENKHLKSAKVFGYGMLGGAFLGSLFGGGYTICTTLKEDPYLEWKVKVLPDKVFPLFKNFLESSELNNFMCPILHDLIIVPVKDPKGRVYEKSAIEYWINDKNASPAVDLSTLSTEADRNRVRFRTSPFCDMNLQLKDLKYDLDYHVRVVAILKRLHDQQLQQQDREGLLAYHLTILKEGTELVGEINKHIGKKHYKGEISEIELLETIKACKEYYSLLT